MHLLKIDTLFIWDGQHQYSFHAFKLDLMLFPLLYHYFPPLWYIRDPLCLLRLNTTFVTLEIDFPIKNEAYHSKYGQMFVLISILSIYIYILPPIYCVNVILWTFIVDLVNPLVN